MTIGIHRDEPLRAQAPLIALVACAGCVALAARGASWRGIAVTLGVGIAAVLAPSEPGRRASVVVWATVAAIGILGFGLVRELTVALPLSAAPAAAAASLAGAVAEELFFRRFLYGALARWGAPFAVVGAAVAFAAVHIPVYGFAVVPIDLAAGLVLGWQRWVTGSWTAPAATHVVANVFSMV